MSVKARAAGVLLTLGFVAAAAAAVKAQSSNDSTVEGVVFDTTGGVLQGATVTAASSTLIGGPRRTTSDSNGRYRLSALPPGIYQLTVVAEGFAESTYHDINLTLHGTAVIDPRLSVAAVETGLVVRAHSVPAPMVDVKSSASPTTLDQQLLYNLPTDRSVVDAIALVPGVNSTINSGTGTVGNMAFGGTQASNALVIDGVALNEPKLGRPWVAFNYNWLDQIQVVALGAPAEYGRTTGATLDAVLRSGTNRFSGSGDYWTTRTGWTADNTSNHRQGLFLDVFNPRTIRSLWDTDVQVGGPIARDRLWFFTGFQYYKNDDQPAGFAGSDYTSERDRRFVTKVDASLGPNVSAQGLVEAGRQRIRNAELSIYIPTSAAAYDSRQTDVVWNARVRWTSARSTGLEVRTSGYNSSLSHDSTLPGGNAGPPAHYDLLTDIVSVNSLFISRAQPTSTAVAASLTTYVGGPARHAHELKFGGDYRRGEGTDFDGFPAGRAYLDYGGQPNFLDSWAGNTVRFTTNETALYVQDQWTPISRFTMNAGVRADFNRGEVPAAGTVLRTQTFFPRVGIAWDPGGDHRNVFRAHYGRYADPLYASHFNFRDRTGINPYVSFQIVGPDRLVEVSRDDYAAFALPGTLSQPHAAETLGAVEHEIAANASILVQYIRRRFKDFIGAVRPPAAWAPVQRMDPGPDGLVGTGDDGGSATVYQRITAGAAGAMVTNPAGAFRDYDAFQIIGRKRYAENWQLLAGWTWSRVNGTVSSAFYHGNAFIDRGDLKPDGAFGDPNQLVNKAVPYTSTELKVEGTYHVSWLGGTNVSAIFRRQSGAGWRRTALFRDLGPIERVLMETEPRYLPAERTVDIRTEKTLRLGRRSLGWYVDVFNVTNQGVPLGVNVLSGPTFGQPVAWSNPRTARAGVRAIF